ncbi:pyruvate kinase [Caballeronia novacaledonica]|uniref:pyruvate kinase n=1 Tax=Caballeronia novacaledonica TaxID=1544861 RepID=A0A2U3ICV9_9BURK|nr:pyruvate kinase [Caballeronia novacaledonica]SPB18027.1 pyruvate kinase [Caballeronia novacaledonica]
MMQADTSWTEQLRRARVGVEQLRHDARAAEQEFAAEIAQVPSDRRMSAINLVHYLAVRRHDVRALQEELACIGLSSLGRMEAHVMASLNAVLRVLHTLLGEPVPDDVLQPGPVSFDSGATLLARHADDVLGPPPQACRTRIMVTMPGDAADDPELIQSLIDAGMDIMRINCAHDTPDTWRRMATQLRHADRDREKRCLISCELAGPKLRTGPIEAGPAVVKCRPSRDALGRVTRAAQVRFVAQTRDAKDTGAAIPVGGAFIEKASAGDTIRFVDARGRKRTLEVRTTRGGECLCEMDRTAYVVPGTVLKLRRDGSTIAKARVGDLPALDGFLELDAGDTLDVVRGDAPGRHATRDESGQSHPASISCAVSEVFASVRAGQPVLFDDGKIRGEISAVGDDRFRVKIQGASKTKLRAGKGINLPESELRLPALTREDIEHLEQVAEYADAVAMSFVQYPGDVDDLLREIDRLGAAKLGIVLKIEKRTAFGNLPELLLSAMRHPKLAVMIARGDLGVEVGFERLSEVQEEMLWLCEAAHVPVIWATQVLESLAKGGLASRAEVTDAAMAGRAESVMLNKGPHIVETLGFLRDVIARIGEHQTKKSARLRRLDVAGSRPRSSGISDADPAA